MAFGKLVWVGLFCCTFALLVAIFPTFTTNIGMDPSGAWIVFAFGIFLILVATTVAINTNRSSDDHF